MIADGKFNATRNVRRTAITAMALALPELAAAQTPSAPSSGLHVTPILDVRARVEHVGQEAIDADALTLRLRAGAQAQLGDFSVLAEAEATFAPVADYNAFPFPAPGASQWRRAFAVVADPENAELNRLQLQYRTEGVTLTIGRQRINLDDQRWVGSVGWRQNEQTFDALRAEARLGPFAADLTYAVSQRTIFGEDAGPRTALAGDFLFAGLSSRVGPIQGKLFAYLVDNDEAFAFSNSNQTYGLILSTSLPIGGDRNLALRGSYARQSDYGSSSLAYDADYWAVEAGTLLAGFAIRAGWEQLGSDNGRPVQTPLATLHKFNGWADIFLTTPPAGLRDAYASLTYRFEGQRLLPGLQATATYHQFDSAVGGTRYGSEWDASIGFRLGRVNLLAKFADYDAVGFGIDTRKFWLQAEWAF